MLIKVRKLGAGRDGRGRVARRLKLDKRAYRSRPAVWGDTPPVERTLDAGAQ